MKKLNDFDIQTIKNKLSVIKPGEVPLPIFLEICRLCVLTTIEIVPIREKDNSVQVLLTKREDNDPTWPGCYHAPGTFLKPTDKLNSLEDAFKRVIEDELKGIKVKKGPVLIEPVFRNLGRGSELTLLYWILVDGETKAGEFFNIDLLPSNLIKKQLKYITNAVKNYTGFGSGRVYR